MVNFFSPHASRKSFWKHSGKNKENLYIVLNMTLIPSQQVSKHSKNLIYDSMMKCRKISRYTWLVTRRSLKRKKAEEITRPLLLLEYQTKTTGIFSIS